MRDGAKGDEMAKRRWSIERGNGREVIRRQWRHELISERAFAVARAATSGRSWAGQNMRE